MMTIELIAAVSMPRRVIGRDGGIPWRLPEDMKRFKQLTTGHVVIMGRRTHMSIGRALPNRHNIVITSSGKAFAGCYTAASLEGALEHLRCTPPPPRRVFIIGGTQLYAAALPQATHVHLTEIALDVKGDTFFPPMDMEQWLLAGANAEPSDTPGVRFATYTSRAMREAWARGLSARGE